MADYTRIRGSKEKIGIVLSTTDSSNFVVESATVTIRKNNPRAGRETVGSLDKVECKINNKTHQKSHKIEYIWDCDGDTGLYTATFSAKLSTGELIVRSVTIDVN